MNRRISLKNLIPFFSLFVFSSLFLSSSVLAQVLVQVADEPQGATSAQTDVVADQDRFDSFSSDLEKVKAEADAIVTKVKQLKERDELVIELQDKLKASMEKEKELVYKLVEAKLDRIPIADNLLKFLSM